jgi:undecaprenyl diphosphate synthase
MPKQPISQNIPKHVAIIMDGNGRWAQARGKSRTAGHRAGVDSVRAVVETATQKGIQALTLFAFSSENWRRPKSEVSVLFDLFLITLQREVRKLCDNNIRLRIIGDISAFPEKLQRRMSEVEQETANNNGLWLQIAANYGGRWDMAQAARQLAEQVAQGKLDPQAIDEQKLAEASVLAGSPDVDLLIRTGGELRISNFLLWHSAYAELYFTPTLWPDFDAQAFNVALLDFAQRQRRFGKTGEQVQVA